MTAFSPRAIYMAQRAESRFHSPWRTDRNLPQHPDGSGFATCPVCDGAGELVVNDTNPYGYGADPQCDECVPCTNTACLDGYVADGEVDPILCLRALRREALTRRPWANLRYGEAKFRAYSPVNLPDAPRAFRLEMAA